MLIGAAMGLWVTVKSYSPVPSQDFWGELPFVSKALDGHLGIGDLWAQDNEHRIVVSRLAFLLEYRFFDGRYVFLITLIISSCLLVACLLALMVWRGSADLLVAWEFGCVAAMAMLSPVAAEAFTFPFNVGYVQIYLYGSLAIGALVLAAGPRAAASRSRAWLAVAIVAAIVGTYSLSNGLLLWPVLLLLALVLRLGRRKTFLLGTIGAGTFFSYLWHFERVSRHSDYGQSIRRPLSIVKYVAVYLGSPARPAGVFAAGFLGLIGLALFVMLLVFALREGASAPITTAAGAGLTLWIFLGAITTAIGRLDFGLTQAMSSRYATPATVFWLGLLMGFLQPVAARVRVSVVVFRTPQPVGMSAFMAIAAAAVFFVGLASLPDRTALRQTVMGKELALLAFRAGVDDPAAVVAVSPSPGPVENGFRWLAAKRLGPWAPGSLVAQSSFELTGELQSVPACAGRVDSVSPVGGGTRYAGWLAPANAAPAASRAIALVDADGVQRGIGLIGTYRRDVSVAGAADSDWTGFVGYTGGRAPLDGLSLILVSADLRRPVCRLEADRPA